MASLRRRAQANVPAASYWLRRVLDDGVRRDQTSASCRGPGAMTSPGILACEGLSPFAYSFSPFLFPHSPLHFPSLRHHLFYSLTIPLTCDREI